MRKAVLKTTCENLTQELGSRTMGLWRTSGTRGCQGETRIRSCSSAILRAAKCEQIFEEKVSGGKGVEERPALKEALRYCREGDVFVVWKLDRLGRSLRDLIDIPQALKERGIGFRSLTGEPRYDDPRR